MAEPISIQQLKDASEDAKSLGEAVNGDENSVVTTRLGETYPTLSNALNQIDSKLDNADTQIKQGITSLFENGGLPAVPFATKAQMQTDGVSLDDGALAVIANGDDAGLYVKESSVWVKAAYGNPRGALLNNKGVDYPLVVTTREGVSNSLTATAKNLILSIKVTGEKSHIGDRIFALHYLQNGYSLNHGVAAGVRILEFSSLESFKAGDAGVVIHDYTDKPLPYDETSSGIKTFTFSPVKRPQLDISLTLDLDTLPWGVRVAGHVPSTELWSSYIDPSCYINLNSITKELWLKNMPPYSLESVSANLTVKNMIKSITILAPKDKLEGFVYRLAYLSNSSDPAETKFRVSRHKVLDIGYDAVDFEWLHELTHASIGYDKSVGGDYTFTMPMHNDPDVIVVCTLDLNILKSVNIVNMWVDGSTHYHTEIINPSNYFATRDSFLPDITPPSTNPYDIGISGVTSVGASLIAYPSNDWVERACNKLGILPINKAEGGVGTQNYFANLIWRTGLWTDEEFEDSDVLVVQFASSKELGGIDGLLPLSTDYTDGHDPLNPEDVPFLDMAENMALDYILKNWLERCLAQKDNPASKWYGYKHGKPLRIMFATHWHDARDYYNLPIREIAARWGAAVCEFDKRIGFSNAVKLPDGTPLSMVYAQDEKSGFGWHPLRGSDGEYVQGRMAGLFYTTLKEHFTQL